MRVATQGLPASRLRRVTEYIQDNLHGELLSSRQSRWGGAHHTVARPGSAEAVKRLRVLAQTPVGRDRRPEEAVSKDEGALVRWS
jgi:hypothetical protein